MSHYRSYWIDIPQLFVTVFARRGILGFTCQDELMDIFIVIVLVLCHLKNIRDKFGNAFSYLLIGEGGHDEGHKIAIGRCFYLHGDGSYAVSVESVLRQNLV